MHVHSNLSEVQLYEGCSLFPNLQERVWCHFSNYYHVNLDRLQLLVIHQNTNIGVARKVFCCFD